MTTKDFKGSVFAPDGSLYVSLTDGNGNIVNLAASGAGGTSGQIQANTSGTLSGFTASGDATINTTTGAVTVTKTNGSAFAASATTDTTNAANISSGTLPAGRLPALTGDVTTSAGSAATTVGKVNGVAYGTSPSSNTVPVVTGANTVTYETVPNLALANSSITLNGTSVSLGGSLSKGWITLDRKHVEQTVVTGIAAKTTSYSVVVPGGTLNTNGSLRISFLWTFVGTAGTKQFGVDWGGTTFLSTNAFAAASLGANGQIVIANRNSASSQIARVAQNSAFCFTNSSAVNATGSINTAADQTLTLWVVMNGANDTGAVESVHVEYNND